VEPSISKIISITTGPPRLLTRSSSRDHASSTYCYHDTRAGAADVPAALHRLMDTDEAIDDADAHIYTTIIIHGECEKKTTTAAESEVLRQVNLAEVIN
jgi:6,7-dimethyl-8-ribityllumazine synthase